MKTIYDDSVRSNGLAWVPMVLMILSNRLVRSAWKAFHCRQHLKMTIAASGRPLWKPTSPAAQHPNKMSDWRSVTPSKTWQLISFSHYRR